MLGLNVIFTTDGTEGRREAFLTAVTEAGLLEAIRNEDGCHQYDFFLSHENGAHILLMEKWENAEKQKIHLTAPHMDAFRATKGDYILDTHIDFYEI